MPQWLMVFFTLVIAGTTLWNGYVISGQWGEMQKQVNVMEANLSQTNRLLDLTDKQIALTRQAIDVSTRSAAAAERASRTAQRSLEISNRAWVGMESLRLKKLLSTDEDTNIEFRFKNTGRSPAINITVEIDIQTEKSPRTSGPSGQLHTALSNAAMAPGQVYLTDTSTAPKKPPADLVQLLNSGDKIFYFYAVITYEDTFRKRRTTKVCGLLRRNSTKFSLCDHHNSMK